MVTVAQLFAPLPESCCLYPCPSCNGPSVLLFPAPKVEWLICERCKIRWPGGYGLVSGSEEMAEDDFKEQAEVLRRYTLAAGEGAETFERWRHFHK